MQKPKALITRVLRTMSKNTMDKDGELTAEEREYILSQAMENA